jgi:hypothetical protein
VNDPRLADQCTAADCGHTRLLHSHRVHPRTYCGGAGCRCAQFGEPPRPSLRERWQLALLKLRGAWVP